MHTLLIGATGATGKDLLSLLLQDNSVHQVDIFVRREISLSHEKLRTHIINFDKPEQWKHLIKGDVLFSCLGTTMKTAGSKAAQWKIDYEYQYQFAKVASENNVREYMLVSSQHASPTSPFYYPKMKGLLEVAVKSLRFEKITIFNPPLLARKNSDRILEVISLKILNFLNKLGLFRSQKPLPTEILAQAMINAAKTNSKGVLALEGEAIWKCAQG